MTIEHLPSSDWDINPVPLGHELLNTIVRLDRDRLEKLITVAIDYLDNIDGDSDEEDNDPDHCIARDDGMSPILCDGRVVWGGEHDAY